MRKSRIIIDGLQRRLAEAEKQRDEARNAVNEGLAKLHRHAEDHAGALAKLGQDLSGLAEAVRTAVRPAAPEAAEPAEPEAPVTPITAKRGTKAAG